MVAPSYTEQRKELAHRIGLGRKSGTRSKAVATGKGRAKESVAAE
jgi:predicted transcriptional regulator